MATSEIEKLERRYAENPHGLTFAPLAEVHRKNGDLARALELLTAGLELHPNYIPASIVLGRCHQDLGDLPSAEAAFAHVLRLDDENVIALKSLADISERLERFGEAETWLRRLVSVDRSNEEAREQLLRIEVAREGQKGIPAEPAPAAPVLEMIDLIPEPVGESPEPTTAPAEPLPEDIAAIEPNRPTTEPPPSREAAVKDEEPAEFLAPHAAAEAPVEEPAEKPVGEPGDISEPGHQAAARAVTPVEESPSRGQADTPSADEPSSEEATVQPLPGLISAEFQPPLEATGGLGVETSEEVVLEVSGESEFRVPDASEDLKSMAARMRAPPVTSPPNHQKEGEPEAAPTAAAEPEFVLTEAMADALMQQGHSADALRVYRELARRNGGDTRLHSRIEELEAAEREAAQRPSYVAAVTKGQSVAAFFRALVAARPPSAPGSVGGNEGTEVSPAIPSGEKKADAAVSFDDFFGSEANQPNPLKKTSDPGKDDLDQFQSWLQNLKP